jgi:alkanesulfonate monooxygenase SsuD/methylene tetrahydromethanopterin reductase-like flavin-dependent oxidoreductase (luciferase family)
MYAHKLDVLKKHCESVGRRFDDIELSRGGDFIIATSKEDLAKKIQIIKPKNMSLEEFVQRNIVGFPEECLKKVEEFVDMGVTYFTISGSSRIREPELKLIAETVMSSL